MTPFYEDELVATSRPAFGKRRCRKCRMSYFTWHTYTNDDYCEDCAIEPTNDGTADPSERAT